LTTGEAADALGVARPTLRRWVKEYGFKPVMVTAGGHYRWDLDDLRRQLEEHRRG
jgi:excisionase family DNA binding protein